MDYCINLNNEKIINIKMMVVYCYILLYILCLNINIYSNANELYEKFQINTNKVDLSAETAKESNMFYKAIARKHIYYPGSLQSKYCQMSNLTIKGSAFCENECFMKVGFKTKVLTASDLKTSDMVISVLHGMGDDNQMKLKANIQCEGAMRFGSASVNETIRQVLNEFNQTKNEKMGSIFDTHPIDLKLPEIPSDDESISFVQIESMSIKNSNNKKMKPVRQWQIFHHDDFDHHSNGWTFNDGTPTNEHMVHCGNGDQFLAVHCVPNSKANDNIKYQNISKTFENLPSHTQIEIKARVHFIDKWLGHVAYLLVDDEIVWMDTHDTQVENEKENIYSINACGHQNWPNDRLAVPITVIIPHTKDTVHLTFGSNVIHNENDLCIGTLGIDDVMVWLKTTERQKEQHY